MRATRRVGCAVLVYVASAVNASAQQASASGTDSCTLLKTNPKIEELEKAKFAVGELRIVASEPSLPVIECKIEKGCIQVDWRIASSGQQDLSTLLRRHRFTDKSPLTIRTVNFNYLHYAVDWKHETSSPDPAFTSLAGQWESIFPLLQTALSVFGGPGGGGTPIPDPFHVWFAQVEYASLCVSTALDSYTDVVLDKDGSSSNRAKLNRVQFILAEAVPRLNRLRLHALGEVQTEKQHDQYSKINQRHADIERRISAFLPLARKAVEGAETVIEPQTSGSTVTIKAQARQGTEPLGQVVTAKYFVGTHRPLVYHVGYGYGRLKDFKFEKVRSLSGEELFAARDTNDALAALATDKDLAGSEAVAFLSWEVKAWGPQDRIGLGLSLGTGLNSPGTSLYYGPTVRAFGRFFVSAGFVSAISTEGENPRSDGEGSSARTLFSQLRESTATKPFFAVSFKVR